MTRQQLLRRAAVGGVTLSLPGFLAACGGGGGIEGAAAGRDRRDDRRAGPRRRDHRLELAVLHRPERRRDRLPDPRPVHRGDGRQGQLPRGHQLERGVLRRDPGAALARPVDRPRHHRPDRLDVPRGCSTSATCRSSTRARSRTWSTSRTRSEPGLGPEPRLQPALADVHHGHRLRPGEGRGRDHLGRAAPRPGPQGQGDDARRLWRTPSALFLLEMGERPGRLRPGRLRRGDRQDPEGGRRRADPPVHGQRLHGPARRAATPGRRIAWSGDIVILQADNPNLEFRIPDAGGMTSVDTMLIPTGGDVYTASTFMNFFYDPADRGSGRRLRELHLAGEGDEGGHRRDRPGARREPAHLPDRPRCSRTSTSSTRWRSRTPTYQEQWQKVIGV